MELSLTLPYPPSVNSYKKMGRLVKTKTGKIYQQRVNTDETKKFYFDVYMLYKKLIPADLGKFDENAVLCVDLFVYPPDDRKRDIDNICKVLLDSLTRAKIIPDDYNIARLYVERCDIIEHGKVVVKIREVLNDSKCRTDA